MLVNIIKKIAISSILAIACIVVVYLAKNVIEMREPYIDISGNKQALTVDLPSKPENNALRFAVATIVSVETTYSTYLRFVNKIGRDIGRNETFIIRPTYKEIREDLEKGDVDVALVCTGTYVHASAGGHVNILVQPEFEEGIDYRCLIIVPRKSRAEGLHDLRGKTMAFTDPESHTGFVVPSVAMADSGYVIHNFFGKIIFTGNHDRSIHAVALGIVDAAGINSLVWESMLREDPTIIDNVRVLWRSQTFGPPHILVPSTLDENMKKSLLDAFLAMDKSREGIEILAPLGIRRFVPGREEDYETAIRLYERFWDYGGDTWR